MLKSLKTKYGKIKVKEKVYNSKSQIICVMKTFMGALKSDRQCPGNITKLPHNCHHVFILMLLGAREHVTSTFCK